MGLFSKIEGINRGVKVDLDIAGYEFTLFGRRIAKYEGPVKLVDGNRVVVVNKPDNESFVIDKDYKRLEEHELLDFIKQNSNNLSVIYLNSNGMYMEGWMESHEGGVIHDTTTIVERVVKE